MSKRKTIEAFFKKKDVSNSEIRTPVALLPRSREEDAELQRSTKKITESTSHAFTPPISFKDKLLGEIPGAFMQAFNLETVNREGFVPATDIGDLSQKFIVVILQPETRNLIRAKWSYALIVKVYGRTVGFHFL